jgi:hypothetical protein
LPEIPNASVRPEARVRDESYERAETARKRPQALPATCANSVVGVGRSERLPIARFHHCSAALLTEAVRSVGQTEQIAGPQIVGVAVNEGEPALQSLAARQAPLASPLVYTRQTRCSPHALSSCWTRFSALIMHLRVHLSWIIIVAPPSDIAISHVPGAGVPGNGAAAIGIIETVVAGFFAGGQQSLAMPPDMILNLSAGHSEGIGGGCG